jgi:hypothetical protein
MQTFLKEGRAIKTPVLTGMKFSASVAVMLGAFCPGIVQVALL